MAGDRPGRQNKGDRVVRTTRLPRVLDDELRERAALYGLNLGEYVSSLVAQHLGHPEHDLLTGAVDEAKRRKELPLTG